MVDKLSLLGKQFSTLSTISQRKNLGDSLGFDNKNSLCLIACSGGPDSLFLAVFIYRYRHIVKGLPLSITKILHFTHSSLPCDTQAYNRVTTLFGSHFEIIYGKTDGGAGKITETVLRNQRHLFFKESIQKFYSPLQSVILCLGHHQDDRIENSFLHMDRGSGLKGILNMRREEKKRLNNNGELLPYIVCRPFLYHTKKEIVLLCNKLSLPFVSDVHNEDRTQKRIQLRKKIELLPEKEKKGFYGDRKYIYEYGEIEINKSCFSPVFISSNRPIKYMYKAKIPLSIHELQQQLSWCGLYTNISEKRLQNILWTFGTAQAFYIQGRRFLQHKGDTYFCFTGSKKRFWEAVHDTQIEIKSSGKYMFGGFSLEVTDSEMVGGTLCFPQIGEKMGSISYTKRIAKQGIPFFWRRSLPIVKKNNKIDKVFTNILQQGTQH